jgi:hypothetical protein
VNSRGGHAQLFFESSIAILQLEGSTSTIAIPQLLKEMLLRNSAIAIFSEVRNFMAGTGELYFCNFRHIYGRGMMKKKSELKNLVLLSL